MATPQEDATKKLYQKKLDELNAAYHKVKNAGQKLNDIEGNLSKHSRKDVSSAIDKVSDAMIKYQNVEHRVEELAKKLGVKYKPLH